MTSLLEHIAARRVVVLCGTGGVGKTTISASIAVQMARAGRSVLVLTIDPARRLAGALGIEGKLNELVEVDLEGGAGTLAAMMLDARRTFDEVVTRFAPSAATRDRILGNPFYQRAAGALSGAHEYMAMEKLLEVHRSGRYDLIVLDTPPTRHALDFLLAPDRLLAVLDGGALRWLAQGGGFSATRAGMRLFGKGREALFSVFERLTGTEVVTALSEFVSSFAELFEGFAERARAARTLLEGPDSAFLLVAAPNRLALNEALVFREELQRRRLPFAGFVINRMPPEQGIWQELPRRPEQLGLVAPHGDADWARCAEEALTCWRNRVREAATARQHVQNLRARCGNHLLYHAVPESETPPASVGELAAVPL